LCNRKYEGGGTLFPQFIVSRVLICLFATSIFTGCVLLAKQAWVQVGLCHVMLGLAFHGFGPLADMEGLGEAGAPSQ
jgi:hypothetical protein